MTDEGSESTTGIDPSTVNETDPDRDSWRIWTGDRPFDRGDFIRQADPDIDTGRGVDQYTSSLGFASSEDFLAFLKGKKICDLGSGLGGLYVESRLLNLGLDITSVNPVKNQRYFEDKQERSLMESFEDKFPREQIIKAMAEYNANLHKTLAHSLPFPDNEFDIIMDSWAVTYYSDRIGGLPLYKKSLREMVRVLKPGGKIRIGEGENRHFSRKTVTPHEEAIKELGLPYNLVSTPDDTNKIIGVEIVKPEQE
jgi:SAM-dependent methyltransferase